MHEFLHVHHLLPRTAEISLDEMEVPEISREDSNVKVRGNQPGNGFISPPMTGALGRNNSVFNLGSTLELKWSTTFPRYDLVVYQQPLSCPDEKAGCANGPIVITSE